MMFKSDNKVCKVAPVDEVYKTTIVKIDADDEGFQQRNSRQLFQVVAICVALGFYMLLLLSWPKIMAQEKPKEIHHEDNMPLFTFNKELHDRLMAERLAQQTDEPVTDPPTTTTPASVDMQLPEIEPKTTLDDVFISVKTTKKYHKERLDVILKTWFKLARDQTYFFSDEEDRELSRKTNYHLVNTRCPSSHSRRALACKMAAEFDHFIQSNKKWWCHFDDDNYVNVPQLVRSLQGFDHRQEWYLGKPSIKDPLETNTKQHPEKTVAFFFGTGGAGFCVSQALAHKMKPYASGGKFTEVSDSIRLPDDVTIGYIAEVLVGRKLTVLPNFHSHLESLGYLDQSDFYEQISFSYSPSGNVLSLDGSPFSRVTDPTRFLSLHCYLYPQFDFCRMARSHKHSPQ